MLRCCAHAGVSVRLQLQVLNNAQRETAVCTELTMYEENKKNDKNKAWAAKLRIHIKLNGAAFSGEFKKKKKLFFVSESASICWKKMIPL